MSDPFGSDSLDSLFASAMEAERLHPQKPRMKNAEPETPKKLKTKDYYTLPENWIPGRVVALMHEESRTLIGNFREYTHKREKGCRDLQRIDGPVEAPVAIEYVRGWEVLGDRAPQFQAQTWTSTQEILMPELRLAYLGVSAKTVLLTAFLSFGGIVRVELKEHTRFVSPTGNRLLTLPTGTNVLEVMDLDGKIELRKELL